MIESFVEYMWYLLTTPLKKIRKTLNKWYILCQVFGRRFDEAKQDILRARKEGMIATCSQEMLQIHAADRQLSRYKDEDLENFRSRIAMYEEICKLGGTNEGILLAIRTLGYKSPALFRTNDVIGYNNILNGSWVLNGSRTLGDNTCSNRWAEFYVVITMNPDEQIPINFSILQKTVRRWKEVGAKDNYLFIFRIDDLVGKIINSCKVVLTARCKNSLLNKSRMTIRLFTETTFNKGFAIEIKNNFFYLDGTYKLDGSKILNTYEVREELK